MKSRALLGMSVLCASCVLGGREDTPPNNDNVSNANNEADMTVDDASATVDMTQPNNTMPDMATVDLSVRDMAGSDIGVDLGVDMRPVPRPFLVAQSHDFNIGRPPLLEPAAVAGFSTGFIVGYADELTERAVFAWYSSDSAEVLATGVFDAELKSVDVSSGQSYGYGIFADADAEHVVAFTPSVAGQPTWQSQVISNSVVNPTRELPYAEENGSHFVVTNPFVGGVPRAVVQTADESGWGFNSTAVVDPIDLTRIEAVGGQRASGFQVLAGGVVGAQYQLIDFEFDFANVEWVTDESNCGAAGNDPRIVPIGGAWAMVESSDGNTLEFVECVDLNANPSTRHVVVTAIDGIADFDVVRENLTPNGNLDIVWVDGETPYIGRVTVDAATNAPSLEEAMPLPGTARRVRAARNTMRAEWGVTITEATSARLVILEPNPDF